MLNGIKGNVRRHFISDTLFFIDIFLERSGIFSFVGDALPNELIFTLAFIPIYYLIARWSLVFPHAATDNNPTFSWAWQLSSSCGFKLFILIGLLPFLTNLLLESIPTYIEPSYALNLVKNTVWLIIATIEVCILSLSYQWLMAKQTTEESNILEQ